MQTDYRKIWESCLEKIRDNVGVQKFDTWFSHLKLIDFIEEDKGPVLLFSVPSQFYFELFEGKSDLAGIGNSFSNLLRSVIRNAFGPGIRLRYKCPVMKGAADTQIAIDAPEPSSTVTNPIANSVRKPSAGKVEYEDFKSQLNPTYNFANYCVGESNRLPFTIADFIAKNPKRTDFNPFFLYGSVGVGKTHLIQAVGTHLKETMPGARVLYVTMRQFQNQYATAKLDKTIPDFINWYQSLDVLMIDDVQELAGKAGTADALFPVLSHLHLNGKKLLFTSDRPPHELDGIKDRIIDRFKWGIVEKLPKPDLELRRSILKSKSGQSGLDLSDEIINVIAEGVTGSIRELEGVVAGIFARAINTNSPVTEALARAVMRNMVKVPEKRPVNFDMILETTAEYYSLNPDVLFARSRVRDIANARQVIMYLCGKHTKLSTNMIAMKLNRSRPTVIHGMQSIGDRIPFEKELAKAIVAIEEQLLR